MVYKIKNENMLLRISKDFLQVFGLSAVVLDFGMISSLAVTGFLITEMSYPA